MEWHVALATRGVPDHEHRNRTDLDDDPVVGVTAICGKAVLGEIGVPTFAQCETGFDLLVQSQKIGDLVMKITSVVEKCHKLEGSMGQLLDKKTIIQMANTFIHIISEEDLPEEVLERIANRILESVTL